MNARRATRSSLLLAILFIAFTSAPSAIGDVTQPAPAKASAWTPEDILSAEYASQWKISPDGKWAVWAKKLTRGSEIHRLPEWSPDGERLSSMSTRPLPKPNPNISGSQIWLMNPFGGEPWPLTEFVRGIQSYRGASPAKAGPNAG
jgi:hypothetical protein